MIAAQSPVLFGSLVQFFNRSEISGKEAYDGKYRHFQIRDLPLTELPLAKVSEISEACIRRIAHAHNQAEGRESNLGKNMRLPSEKQPSRDTGLSYCSRFGRVRHVRPELNFGRKLLHVAV
jgi:hypothetical protein